MTKQKFDVVLATGTVWDSSGEYVYRKHIQNHLRILDESTYYALRARNGPFRKHPDIFRGLCKHLTYLRTAPITENTSSHVWQK